MSQHNFYRPNDAGDQFAAEMDHENSPPGSLTVRQDRDTGFIMIQQKGGYYIVLPDRKNILLFAEMLTALADQLDP